MKNFFVGCNLHFEIELEKELAEIWPYLIDLDGRPQGHPLDIVERFPGGLVLQAPLHVGLQINFFSKLANRVLLRLKEMRVRDFPKLFQKLQELKNDPFLKVGPFHFQVAAQRSRLNNEKRIHEILCEVFGAEDEKSKQAIYVRMDDDLCTVSLDSTGTHLHKRTQRVEQGEASLRETLAAFCARQLIGDHGISELAEVTLVDPLCGTGSLLREARSLYQPQVRSDFSFLSWPQTAKILKSPSLKSNYPEFPLLFQKLLAADRDRTVLEVARSSLAEFAEVTEFEMADVFLAKPRLEPQKRWVISNPPYGERLKADFEPRQLIEQLNHIYKPRRMALLFGEQQARRINGRDLSLNIENELRFKNGGLPVHLFIFTAR